MGIVRSELRCLRAILALATVTIGLQPLAAAERKLVRELRCNSDKSSNDPVHVDLGNGGKLVATGGDKGNFLWDVGSGKVKLKLNGHKGPALVAFSPDDRHLVSAYGNKIIVWDLKTSMEEKTITIDKEAGELYQIAVSPSHIAVAMQDLSTLLYDRATFQKVHTFLPPLEFQGKAHRHAEVLQFSGDGSRLLMGFAHQSGERYAEVLNVFDVKKKQVVTTIVDRPHVGYQSRMYGAAISRDGKQIAHCGWRCHVKVWNASNGELVTELGVTKEMPHRSEPTYFLSVAFSPDDKHITAPHLLGGTWIWNIATKKEVKLSKDFCKGVYGLIFSPDGHFAASNSDGVVYVWDLRIAD